MAPLRGRLGFFLRRGLSGLATWVHRWSYARRGARWVLRRAPRLHAALSRARIPPGAHQAAVVPMERDAQKGGESGNEPRLSAASSELERVSFLLRRAIDRQAP